MLNRSYLKLCNRGRPRPAQLPGRQAERPQVQQQQEGVLEEAPQAPKLGPPGGVGVEEGGWGVPREAGGGILGLNPSAGGERDAWS